jgi:hypothetical protein
MDRDYPQAWRFTYANLATGGTATIRVRLREWSSAPRTAWTNAGMNTNVGHYTELVRTVNSSGTAYRLYFDWPGQDGDYVEAGWTIYVKYFSHWAGGLNGDEPLDYFTIRLNSTENGGLGSNGEVLSHEDINITHQWNWDGDNTITFEMPNVYNGQPDWLHTFEITGQRSGLPDHHGGAAGHHVGRTAAVDPHHPAARTGQRRQAACHHPGGRAGFGSGDKSIVADDQHPVDHRHGRRGDGHFLHLADRLFGRGVVGEQHQCRQLHLLELRLEQPGGGDLSLHRLGPRRGEQDEHRFADRAAPAPAGDGHQRPGRSRPRRRRHGERLGDHPDPAAQRIPGHGPALQAQSGKLDQ